jgi:hypothetical protein
MNVGAFTTLAFLVQSCAIKNTAIVAGNETLCHMSAIAENQFAP